MHRIILSAANYYFYGQKYNHQSKEVLEHQSLIDQYAYIQSNIHQISMKKAALTSNPDLNLQHGTKQTEVARLNKVMVKHDSSLHNCDMTDVALRLMEMHGEVAWVHVKDKMTARAVTNVKRLVIICVQDPN